MSFNNYIYQFTKDTDKNQTHLSFNGGKYNVPDEKFNEFYERYYQALKKNKEELYIIEKVSNSKFAFFLDIEPKKGSEIVVNETDMKLIITITESCIEELFVLDENSDLEKHVISKRNDNYHINYYNLIVNNDLAKQLYTMIVNKLPENLKNVIDGSVYRTGLRLLGSKKKNEKKNETNQKNSMEFYKIYDIDTKEYLEIEKTSFDLFMKTVVRRKNSTKLSKTKVGVITKNSQTKKIQVRGITNEKVIEEIQKLLHYLKHTDDILAKMNLTIERIYAAQNKTGVFCYYISISEDYCPFKERCHKRDNSPIYIEISTLGIFIKCYDQDCLRRRFPEKGISFPENFENDYKEMYLSMTTRYWRSEVEITKEIRWYLEDSLNCSHFKIAKVVFEIYKSRFRVDDVKNTDWYEFDGIRWKRSHIMNILISEELPKYYNAIKISDTSMNSSDLKEYIVNQEQVDANIRNQLVDAIISKLENVTFKNNILTQAAYLFKNHDPEFCSKLDSNPYLIGFKNGVYDLESHKFRNGSLTDYITFSTGYDYTAYDSEDPITKEIYSFLSKIITKKNVLEYTLKVLGRALVGIPDEKFYIWTGLSGANGKSTLVNFLEATLGEYITSADVSLLTNKRNNSSNASPDVIRLKGKRIFSFQEPEHDDKLRTGILKQFTGGDTIIARELFKAPVSFKLQGTMIMCCNDLPTVSSTDGGTWRRIRVVQFNSRFCENPVKENEFKIDPSIKYKLQKWKPYFMSILLHHYKLYQEYGMQEPDDVKHATNRYKVENDKFNEFFDMCLEESKDSFESTKSIYSQFTNWWLMNYPNSRLPELKEIKRACKTKYGQEIEQIVNGLTHLGFRVHIKSNFIHEIENETPDNDI